MANCKLFFWRYSNDKLSASPSLGRSPQGLLVNNLILDRNTLLPVKCFSVSIWWIYCTTLVQAPSTLLRQHFSLLNAFFQYQYTQKLYSRSTKRTLRSILQATKWSGLKLHGSMDQPCARITFMTRPTNSINFNSKSNSITCHAR